MAAAGQIKKAELLPCCKNSAFYYYYLSKSWTCENFAAAAGGALVHEFPNLGFFSSTSNLGLVKTLLLNLGEHWCTNLPTWDFFFSCTPSGGPLALGKEGK